MRIQFWTSISICLLALSLSAEDQSAQKSPKGSIPSHEATREELAKAVWTNLALPRVQNINTDLRPVVDTADFEYVLLTVSNYSEGDEIKNMRELIARNLPDGVKLVVLTSTKKAKAVYSQFSAWIPSERLIVVSDSDPYFTNGFWARDSFPIPVINRSSGAVSLVGKKYFAPFPSSGKIAESVSGKLDQKSFTFVGGNLLADDNGNCFVVDSLTSFQAQ